MTAHDERELEWLGGLDPVLRDAPPAPGSDRHRAILEKAMTQTATPIRTHTEPAAPRRRRWAGLAALATGVAAAAVGVAVVVGGNAEPAAPPTASGPTILLAAAKSTEKATSLRFSEAVHGGGAFSSEGEVSGADWRVVSKGEGTSETTVMVGDYEYVTPAGGETTRKKVPADQRMAPFAKAAADVVRAAVNDANVEKVGTEEIRGVTTTHYRVTLPERTGAADPEPALAELPENELAWFQLEGIGSYSSKVTIDVWVADDLVRRIGGTVEGQDPLSTIDFYDFNAPIAVKAP